MTRIERAWISNDKQFATMSALGQKPTFALQKAMSALHPIATAKADMKFPNRKFCRSVLQPLQHPILGCGRGGVDPTCGPPEAMVGEVEGENVDTTYPPCGGRAPLVEKYRARSNAGLFRLKHFERRQLECVVVKSVGGSIEAHRRQRSFSCAGQPPADSAHGLPVVPDVCCQAALREVTTGKSMSVLATSLM